MEVLPEELLVKIFSYFTWCELKELSLVNRRWYRVAGTRPLLENVSLALSKVDTERSFRDSYIDNGLLFSSKRQYSGVSCWLCFSGDILIKLSVLGNNLTACLNKWNVARVRIVGQYDQILVFLQRYGVLLAKVVELSVTLEQFSAAKCYEKNYQGGCILELGTLERFSWIELSLPNLVEPMPYSFTFVVPKLQSIKGHILEKRGIPLDNYLMLFDCIKVKKVDINSYELLSSSLFDSDCTTLEQLTINGIRGTSVHLRHRPSLLQKLNYIDLAGCDLDALDTVCLFAKNLRVLKLSLLSGSINFDTGLQQLREIRLQSLDLIAPSTNDYIECPNLQKLTLLNVNFATPIKLRAPLLNTLVTDTRSSRSIELEDKTSLQNLGVSSSFMDVHCPDYPNVTHLYLRLGSANFYPPEIMIKQVLDFYRLVSKLTVFGTPQSCSNLNLEEILHNSRLLESLHLHSINTITLGAKVTKPSLKRLLITNSSIDTVPRSLLEKLEWVRFYQVRIADSPRASRYYIDRRKFPLLPLFVDELRSDDALLHFCPATNTYSTPGFMFDEKDGMLNW